MSRHSLAVSVVRCLLTAAVAIAFAGTVSADCAPCGPLYCKDTPGYATALATKKRYLASHGYRARLIAILDHLGHCEGCVSTAPDAFSLMIVNPDNSLRIDGYDAANERNGAHAVTSGDLKKCYVIYVRHACACCQEKKFDQRSDYDAVLDLNTDMAVACAG